MFLVAKEKFPFCTARWRCCRSAPPVSLFLFYFSDILETRKCCPTCLPWSRLLETLYSRFGNPAVLISFNFNSFTFLVCLTRFVKTKKTNYARSIWVMYLNFPAQSLPPQGKIQIIFQNFGAKKTKKRPKFEKMNETADYVPLVKRQKGLCWWRLVLLLISLFEFRRNGARRQQRRRRRQQRKRRRKRSGRQRQPSDGRIASTGRSRGRQFVYLPLAARIRWQRPGAGLFAVRQHSLGQSVHR